MNESPQQYAARISSYVAGKNHLKILTETPKRLQRLLRSQPKQLLISRPGPDKWSVGEILAHLTEGEIVIAFRLRMVASANGTPIAAYDQDLWQANAGYLKKNPEAGLTTFTTLRNLNIAFLKSLSDEKRNYYGMHSERGQESIVRMMELYAGHDENHLMQIEKLLEEGKKRGGRRRKKKEEGRKRTKNREMDKKD